MLRGWRRRGRGPHVQGAADTGGEARWPPRPSGPRVGGGRGVWILPGIPVRVPRSGFLRDACSGCALLRGRPRHGLGGARERGQGACVLRGQVCLYGTPVSGPGRFAEGIRDFWSVGRRRGLCVGVGVSGSHCGGVPFVRSFSRRGRRKGLEAVGGCMFHEFRD